MKTYQIKWMLIFFVIFSTTLLAQTEDKCLQVIRGQVKDRVTDTLLTDAVASLVNTDGVLLVSQPVNERGEFLFNVSCERQYELKVTAPEYTEESKSFSTDGENDKRVKTMVLLDKGEIDFLSNPIASNEKVELIGVKSDSIMVSIHPNEISLNGKERLPKDEENLLQNKDSLNTLEVRETSDRYVININPIFFDLGSSYFNASNKKKLQEIVKLMMKEYPKMKIEIGANSDVQGTSDYNQWLSDRRAKRVKDYLVSRGIAPERIATHSFGDTQIINKCMKGVDCSDEEHAQNRRVEFLIVSM